MDKSLNSRNLKLAVKQTKKALQDEKGTKEVLNSRKLLELETTPSGEYQGSHIMLRVYGTALFINTKYKKIVGVREYNTYSEPLNNNAITNIDNCILNR